jgi:hypothetical protein
LNKVVTITTVTHGSAMELQHQARIMPIQSRRRDGVSRLLVL